MSEPLFLTTDIWVAACCTYLYSWGCLASITDEETDNRHRVTTYGLAVPSEDVNILVEEYRAGKLNLASARDFVLAFNHITSKQKQMRLRGDICWTSERWQRGEIG